MDENGAVKCPDRYLTEVLEWVTPLRAQPGGRCYLRLRAMEDLVDELPWHVFRGETRAPNGRIIWI